MAEKKKKAAKKKTILKKLFKPKDEVPDSVKKAVGGY